MPTERLANKGYMAAKKQVSALVAITPTVYFALDKSSMETSMNIQEDGSIVGHSAARNQYLSGMRNHGGEFSVLAEPNTAGFLFDAFGAKGTTTGSNPYTHPFTPSTSNYYTVDFAKGSEVHRFIGVQISQIQPAADGNRLLLNCKASALRSFINRTIASVSGSGPYTLTLSTDYTDSPTDGLVVGDLIRVWDVSAAAEIQATVATIPSGTTLTCVANVSAAVSGDILTLRPATVSLNHLTPFLVSSMEFRFAADATTALTATQVRTELGSAWTLQHMFENDEGSKRTGGRDPETLVRTLHDGELKTKIFFDDPEDLNKFMALTKRACVVRHFASGSTYELRVTLNNLKLKSTPTSIEKGGIIYKDQVWSPQYDATDAQMWDVKVINAVSTI